MAPDVNWNVIENVVKTQHCSEGDIEQVVDLLKGMEGDEYAKEPEKILLLYKSAMKALDSREKAMEDFLQEQEDLIAENEELKKDLEESKSFGRGPTKDVDFYRLESRKQTEEIQLLQRDVEDLRNELDRATQERYNHEKDLEDAKRTARHLKEENRSLVDSLREYRNIVENQQQKYKDNTSADSKDKIIEKNKQISELIDQITHLEEQNRELVEGNKKMRSEMESGQEDMEKMAEEYEKMRKVIGASDHFADDLHRQNAQLKVQVDDLRDQLRSREEEEDTIANAVDQKVQEWTKKLQQRDQENIEQGRIISNLRQKITAVSLDQDRINVERLTKRLEEKEKQNKELHDNLNQAVTDLEEQTTLVEELRDNKGTNKETLAYRSQIRNLQSQVSDNEATTRDAKAQQQRVENEAQETDVKLTEALKRVALLESGQYGLTEAVEEIKQCKSEIRARDKDIQDLTREANKLEEKLNDLLEENEEYRERLGVDPRDMNDIINLRKSRGLRQQQYRAENQVLLKEIENLEEERIQLKKQIRRQAQSQTQKAIGEGLHSDDIDRIDDFIEELKRKRKHGISEPTLSRQKITNAPSERWASPQNTISQQQLNSAHADNAKLKQESKVILSENDDLRTAMKDILHELKQSNNSPRPIEVLKLPSIERLLHAMESRQVAVEGNSHFKAEVDQLTGRNEEIRSEMREMRSENSKLSAQNEIYRKQVSKLQNDLEEMNKIDFVRNQASMVNLPSNPDSSSDDIINALNEQLIQTLHDSSKKLTQHKEVKEALENSRRQLNVLRQQTYLLYKEHLEEKSKLREKTKGEDERMRKMQEQHDRDVIKVDEYERILVTLKSDPDEMKKRLAETSRKVSLLRVNEKTLIRRHKALEVTEELLTSENSRLKNEIIQIEKAVAERIGYLERYKAMASFKIDAMQKSLEGSVPESELSQVNRRFDELTSKYRDILQKENQFVTRNMKVEELQEELKITNEEMVSLREELSIEKEKRHVMEEAGKRAGLDPSRIGASSEVSSFMKQVLSYFLTN